VDDVAGNERHGDRAASGLSRQRCVTDCGNSVASCLAARARRQAYRYHQGLLRPLEMDRSTMAASPFETECARLEGDADGRDRVARSVAMLEARVASWKPRT
jgi:hypothetical protein